ncbi:MAG: chemotaxis protein CheB, partial [Cyanobacteriota bacterium]|nr:chemotaxis protein CheB [Cyanobacteriota bacterium]
MTASPCEPATGLVAIGASAGGLEALRTLVQGLRPDLPLAVVVAQHLAPDHPSRLAALLQPLCPLPVAEAADGEVLQPGRLLVVPPGHDAVVTTRQLRLVPPLAPRGSVPSLDRLLASLAEGWGERAVAVLLSGHGSDGAQGLRQVRAAGGLTLAQTPASAACPALPAAAIRQGGAELVLEPAAIAAAIQACAAAQRPQASGVQPEPSPAMVSALVLQHTGLDVSGYKSSTLRRQVARRQALSSCSCGADYEALLAASPEEARILASNLMVSVTRFFRDPEVFEGLAEQLRARLAGCQERRLRVWVPGCATGEEAYTLAMVISAALDHPADLSQHLRLFATDIDDTGLAITRAGLYPATAAETIPPELGERFTTVVDQQLQMHKSLRACLVVARHNLLVDPPFPGLDLVSCRNTLIYFTAPLQAQVVDRFRFALLPGGLLLLGLSESLGTRMEGFTAVQGVPRLYTHLAESRDAGRPPATLRRGGAPLLSPWRPAPLPAPPGDAAPALPAALGGAVLAAVCGPALLLDDSQELLTVIGDGGRYCRLPEGRPSLTGVALLRPELQVAARALLLLVRTDGAPVLSEPLQLDGEGVVQLEARPLAVADRRFSLLRFLSQPPPGALEAETEPAVRPHDPAFSRAVAHLEQQLLASQEHLRRSLEELEQANEELEASSEELQASSEELQSSNEELEASNEELQATNDELVSLNQQLRSRSEELEQLNNELENIQRSLSQGMVIVDARLRVTRFSPLAVRLFGLVDDDIGRPLLAAPTTMPLPELGDALREVVDGIAARRNLEADNGEIAYLVQVLPYQELGGRQRGAILTLTDVSEPVGLRRVAENALHDFTTITDGLEQVVWKRDAATGRLLYISQPVQDLTGWSARELV